MDRREALAEDLRALAEDLKSLVDTATTDPKERQRKERLWTMLVGGFGLVSTLVARRLAVKAWGILTGETAPAKTGPPQSATDSSSTEERSPARPAA
jgi:hypothetical protein